MKPDPTKCPLCGQSNVCAVASGCGTIGDCWCNKLELSGAMRDQVGAGRVTDACVCETCLRKLSASESSPPCP